MTHRDDDDDDDDDDNDAATRRYQAGIPDATQTVALVVVSPVPASR